MNIQHPYNRSSEIYNFFFHPKHVERNKTAALIVHVALTIFTAFLWQIPFWIVNRLDHRKVKSIDPINNENSANVRGNETVPIPGNFSDSLVETSPTIESQVVGDNPQSLFLRVSKQEIKDIINAEYPELISYCEQNNVRDYATEQIREYLQNHDGELVAWDEFIEECLLDKGITYELYEDPVIANDGYTYSKDALYRWFGGFRGGGHSYARPQTPLTKKECNPGDEIRHPIISKLIDKYRSEQSNIGQRFLDAFPQEIREFSMRNRRGEIRLSLVRVTQVEQRGTYEGSMCFGRTLTGRTLTCYVGQDTTVLQLKQQVLDIGRDHLGGDIHDPSQIRIIFCGRQLDDDANARIVTTENCFHVVIKRTSDEELYSDAVVNRVLSDQDLLRKSRVFSVLERIWERGKEDHLTRDGKKASDTLRETLDEANQLIKKIDQYFDGGSQEDRCQGENYYLNSFYSLVQRDIECLNILLAEKIAEELLEDRLDTLNSLINDCTSIYEQHYLPITKDANAFMDHDAALQLINEAVAKAEELMAKKNAVQEELDASFPDLDRSCLEHLFRHLNQSHRHLWNLVENLAARGGVNSVL